MIWLAQLEKHHSAKWEVAGSNPGWTNPQGELAAFVL